MREALCAQASTAVGEAHCAQATVARLVTFESLKWKYSFALLKWKYSFAKFEVEIFFRIVYEIRLIAIREVSPPFGEEHLGLEQDISFPGNKHLLILRKCYAVHINACTSQETTYTWN